MPAPPAVRRDIPARLIRLFDRATRAGRGPIRQTFLSAVREILNNSWTIAELEAELRRAGNLEALLEGITGQEVFGQFRHRQLDSYEGPLDESGRRIRHRAPVVDVYVSAGDAAVVTSPIRDSWWSTDRFTQRAIDWVDSIGAQRVTVVGESTKAGIRTLLSEAFATGQDRDWIKRALVAMDGDGTLRLGLDKPRARAYMRFIEELEPKLSAKRRAQLIGREYNRLLRSRAATVAQTEVVTIGNTAQMDTYQTAAMDGALDTEIYILEWVTRTIGCARCIPMDGATREILSGRFVSDGSGPKGVESAEQPCLHPRGWCFSRVIRRSEARRQPVV